MVWIAMTLGDILSDKNPLDLGSRSFGRSSIFKDNVDLPDLLLILSMDVLRVSGWVYSIYRSAFRLLFEIFEIFLSVISSSDKIMALLLMVFSFYCR